MTLFNFRNLSTWYIEKKKSEAFIIILLFRCFASKVAVLT